MLCQDLEKVVHVLTVINYYDKFYFLGIIEFSNRFQTSK